MRWRTSEWLHRTCVVAVGLACVGTVSNAVSAVATQMPPEFRASDIFRAGDLVGANYSVNPKVRNNGYLNVFTVNVEGDQYGVVGNALMSERLHELVVLQRMDMVQRSDVYIEAVKNAGMAPLELAGNLVTSPIDTVGALASGFGTFFESVGHSMFGGASEHEEGMLKTMVGFDAAKRQFAFEFGIDPYTSFPPVQDRLNEIALAATGGSLTVSAAFSFAGPAATPLGATKMSEGMRKLIRDKTPAELKDINADKLSRMDVNSSIADLFLEHPKFSPSEKTLLVGALASVGAHGRQVFIERAIAVHEEPMAYHLRRWAQMIAAYHGRVKPVQRFVGVGKGTFVQNQDGVLVGLFPVDHIAWTQELASRHATNMQALPGVENVTGGEMWLEGTISTKAREALESQGWVIKERVGPELGI